MGRRDLNEGYMIFTRRLFIAGSLLTLLAPAQALAAPAVELPRTGQTTCWNSGGNQVPCAETGHDGDVQAGVAWPAPRFIDNGNGTLTDRVTDLVWLRNADCQGVVTWQHALDTAGTLAAGACGLNDGSVAGSWRLPNRKELLSIMSFQQDNGATWLASQGFVNGIHGWYWTSDSYAPNPAAKWVVHTVGAAWADSNPLITSPDFHALYVRNTGAPELRVSPDHVSFGDVEVHRSSPPLPVLLQNAGNEPLQIASMAVSGDDAARFSLDPGTGSSGTCGTLTPFLAAGQSCSVSLIFSPVVPGARTASLAVLPQGGNASGIVLTGNGIQPLYRVSANASGGNGTVSPAGMDVPAGGTAAITVIPAEGYRADSSVGGTCPGGSFAGTTYTTGTITAACTADFSFVPRLFTVSTVANGNGSVACTPSVSVPYLTTVSCTVTPAEGGIITGVAIDGIQQNVTDSLTFLHSFGQVAMDHTIVATFAAASENVFTATPASEEHGAMTPQTPQTVSAGSTVTFAVTPGSGYRIASVSGCGGSLHEDLFTTAPLSENCTVTARFEPNTVADAMKAFRYVLGLVTLSPQDKHSYDVAPLGIGGNPEPDGTIGVGDIVIMLRRLAGLINW